MPTVSAGGGDQLRRLHHGTALFFWRVLEPRQLLLVFVLGIGPRVSDLLPDQRRDHQQSQHGPPASFRIVQIAQRSTRSNHNTR